MSKERKVMQVINVLIVTQVCKVTKNNIRKLAKVQKLT